MTQIYGRDMDLTDPESDGVVVDIVVLARVSRLDEDGEAWDELLVSVTDNTGVMMQRGLLEEARDILRVDFDAAE